MLWARQNGLAHSVLCLLFVALISLSECLSSNSSTLVIATTKDNAVKATYILNGYGLGFEVILVPHQGISLPVLNSTDGGNYGLVVIVSEAVYIANGTSTTALTTAQWDELYDYQRNFNIRMVHLDVAPGPKYGTAKSSAGCCTPPSYQNVSVISEVQHQEFPNAGIRSVGLNTSGLFHYPTTVSNDSTTTAFIEFGPHPDFPSSSVAGVINKFEDGREQMAFFIDAGNFSATSTLLNHAWVQWGYRGLYPGYRRLNLETQVDDLLLATAMYTGGLFRLRAEDLQDHVDWTIDINKRLNPGSTYFVEFGFNANGNLIYGYDLQAKNPGLSCDSPVFSEWHEATLLEFQKPLGTGTSYWPLYPSPGWTGTCLYLDPIVKFLNNITNRDAYGLVTHTFTHLELNNATYHDATREISFNLLYAELLNFTSAAKFSGSGLIPPAITGVHNGDVLRAWSDNGLWNAIGDNTRPLLRNSDNQHWPLISNMADNGYDGYQITPRFATMMYYDCDLSPCNVKEWVDTSDGTNDIYALLDISRNTVANQLLSLYHDPYMFHQPNLRSNDVGETYVNGRMQKLSLLQMWVEVVTFEITRVVNWPLITLKHDHIAMSFNRRFVRDSCAPSIRWTTSDNSSQITGFDVLAATNNTCSVTVPVTVPGSVKDTKGFFTEQLGSDPMTIWVDMRGSAVHLDLDPPIDVS